MLGVGGRYLSAFWLMVIINSRIVGEWFCYSLKSLMLHLETVFGGYPCDIGTWTWNSILAFCSHSETLNFSEFL